MCVQDNVLYLHSFVNKSCFVNLKTKCSRHIFLFCSRFRHRSTCRLLVSHLNEKCQKQTRSLLRPELLKPSAQTRTPPQLRRTFQTRGFPLRWTMVTKSSTSCSVYRNQSRSSSLSVHRRKLLHTKASRTIGSSAVCTDIK